MIAVLLLKHVLEQELEDRAVGQPSRISFFLVTSITISILPIPTNGVAGRFGHSGLSAICCS